MRIRTRGADLLNDPQADQLPIEAKRKFGGQRVGFFDRTCCPDVVLTTGNNVLHLIGAKLEMLMTTHDMTSEIDGTPTTPAVREYPRLPNHQMFQKMRASFHSNAAIKSSKKCRGENGLLCEDDHNCESSTTHVRHRSPN